MAKSQALPKSAMGRQLPRNAPEVETEDSGSTDFPKSMYRKVKPSAKCPNGYEVRRIEDEEELAKLDDKIWKDSPEGMTPDVPFGHKD